MKVILVKFQDEEHKAFVKELRKIDRNVRVGKYVGRCIIIGNYYIVLGKIPNYQPLVDYATNRSY